MKIIFILNAVVFLGIFLFLIKNYYNHFKRPTKKVVRFFVFIGFAYLFLALSSILWATGILDYTKGDFLFLYSACLILQSLILFRMVYLFSGNKRMYFFLGLYLVGLGSLLLVFHNFLAFSLILSFLFMMLLSLEFVFVGGNYKNVGYFGLFYSFFSLGLYFFIFYTWGNLYLFSLISNVLFFGFIYIFLRDLEKYSLKKVVRVRKERSYLMSLLGHLIFIMTLANFIFIGTVGIHEFGHYGVSKFYNCEYRKIVYENDFFHTEILCENLNSNLYVVLGGVLLPFIVAGLLFLVGGPFANEVGLLMIGFNLLSVSKDFQDLRISPNLTFASIFLGIIVLIYGLLSLSRRRVENDVYLYGLKEPTKFERLSSYLKRKNRGVKNKAR